MNAKESRKIFFAIIGVIMAFILDVLELFISDNFVLFCLFILIALLSIWAIMPPFLAPSYPPFEAKKYGEFFASLTSSKGIIDNKENGELIFKIDTTLDITKTLEEFFLFAQNKGDAEISGKINAEAFRGTPWAGEGKNKKEKEEKKIKRNYSFIQKNRYTIAMLSHSLMGYPIYYAISCILPLTKEGYDKYTTGNIKDINFPADFIAQESTDVYALLLFMIGGKKKGVNKKVFEDAPMVIRFMVRHLALLGHNMQLRGKTLSVLTQAERKIQKPLMRFGFIKDPNLRTADDKDVMKASMTFI